jgi:hypothetical protein
VHPKKRAEASGGFRLTTNNRMEIYAAVVFSGAEKGELSRAAPLKRNFVLGRFTPGGGRLGIGVRLEAS